MKKIALLLLGVCVSCAYAAPDVRGILLRIEERMSGVRTIEADVTQEKRLAVFSYPVTLKGRIFIQKPQLFSWHVQSPVRYAMLIRDDVIKQWDQDANQVQQFSLSGNPAFSVAIAQMKVWFSGAYSSLLNEYEVKSISEIPVVLEFTPLESNPAFSLIKTVRVSFENDERYLREIAIEEKNGDVTILTFSAVKLNMPINPSAWELKPDAR